MGIWWLIGNIMLLLFGFVVFLVLSCVVYVVYIVYKTLFTSLLVARKIIYILKDRKKTLKSILDLDMRLVNKSDDWSYLSYNNRLLRLYKGPDKNGNLCIPEGIESIDECAFDDFLVYDKEKDTIRFKEGVSAIVLPSTIKELDIDNIPDETTLAFTDARSKNILRSSEDDLGYREMEIKGGLFSEVLKDCETLEHRKDDDEGYDDEFPEIPNILDPNDIERINDAFSQIDNPSLKIKLIDRFHALVLSGDMSIPDFEYLLTYVNFEPKDRYFGTDVIEKIYGSVEDAYTRFETQYYKSENIRKREAAAERTQTCAPGEGPEWTCEKNVIKTIELVESVAKDPTAFLTDDGWELKTPDDVK